MKTALINFECIYHDIMCKKKKRNTLQQYHTIWEKMGSTLENSQLGIIIHMRWELNSLFDPVVI